MSELKEGYSIVIINDIKYKTCNDCSFCKRTLVRSGRYPLYEFMCRSELVNMYHTLKYLRAKYYDYILTPYWCPYTDAIEREDKINKLLNEEIQGTSSENGE